LDDLRGRRRRPLAPELVDDAVGGKRFIAMEEEQGEEGALPAAAERELMFAVANLERPENAEVHVALLCEQCSAGPVTGHVPALVTDLLPPNGRTWTAALNRPVSATAQGSRRDEGVVMKMLSNRLLKGLAAVLAAGTIATPAALGSGPSSPDTQDAAKAGQSASPTDMIAPDTQDAAKAGRSGSAADMIAPDTQDTAKGRGLGGPTIEVVTVAAASRFDWIDAGIGAASGLGASLIGAGGLILVLKRHRRSVAVA
jgi:hypothetical protein